MSKPNAAVKKHVNEIAYKLEALITEGIESGCAVKDEHKQAVKLYISTWVLPRVKVLQEWAETGKIDYRGKF